MTRIWAVVLASVLSGCATGANSSTLIQLRLAEYERPGESVERAQFNGQDVYLHPQVVVSDQDITGVETSFDGGAVLLDVQFSPEGAERLRNTTAGNIGSPMALLFDGRIVSIPVIRDEISMDRVRMAIPVDSEEQGQAVIERVRARWPTG